MTITEPIDWDYHLANTIYFNTRSEPDDLGCLWAMPTPDGWESAVFRGTQTNIPSADGAEILDSYLGARLIHGQGQVQGPNARAIELAKQRMEALCNQMLRADSTFGARLDTGVEVFCTVRLGGQPAFPTRNGPESVMFDFLVQAGDPRKYGAVLKTATVPSSTHVGGAFFPITFPVTFTPDADVTTPTATSTNAGNALAPFVVVFNGPLNAPLLIDSANDFRIPILTNLAAGQSITIDTLNETVVFSDGLDVYRFFDDATGTPLDQLRIPAADLLTGVAGECQWLLLGDGTGDAVITSRDTSG